MRMKIATQYMLISGIKCHRHHCYFLASSLPLPLSHLSESLVFIILHLQYVHTTKQKVITKEFCQFCLS